MNERDYLRLKRELESEYHRKCAALETVWRMVREGAESRPAAPKGAVLEGIRAALADLSEPFTIKNVMARIKETNAELAATLNRATLSRALKRLSDDHEIELVTTGAGKRPSTYKRPSVAS